MVRVCYLLKPISLNTFSALWTVSSLKCLKCLFFVSSCFVVDDMIEFIIETSVLCLKLAYYAFKSFIVLLTSVNQFS